MVPPVPICSPGHPKDPSIHSLHAHQPQAKLSTPSRHISHETRMTGLDLATLPGLLCGSHGLSDETQSSSRLWDSSAYDLFPISWLCHTLPSSPGSSHLVSPHPVLYGSPRSQTLWYLSLPGGFGMPYAILGSSVLNPSNVWSSLDSSLAPTCTPEMQ